MRTLSACLILTIGLVASVARAQSLLCQDSLAQQKNVFAVPDGGAKNQNSGASPVFANAEIGESIKTLYRDGKPSLEYEKVLQSLASSPSGVILDFGDGDRFVFQKYLGAGATTVIVKTTTGEVLRIPKVNRAYGHVVEGKPPPVWDHLLNDYVKIQAALSAAGVKSVRIDIEKSRLPKFLVVEEKNILLLAEYFLYPWRNANLSQEDIKFLKDKYIEFARSTWAFAEIGDSGPKNIAFDGEDWFALDFAFSNKLIVNHRQRQTTFDRVDGEFGWEDRVPEDMHEIIVQEIVAERERQFRAGHFVDKDPVWFERNNFSSTELLDFLIPDQKGGQQIPRFRSAISTGEFRKRTAKNLKGVTTEYFGDKEISIEIGRMVAFGEETALYEIELGESPKQKRKQKGFIEIRQKIENKKDRNDKQNLRFPLLKEKGIKKSDLDAIGPDFVIYLK